MSVQTALLASVIHEAKPGFASGDDLDEGVFQIRMNNITRDGALDLTKKRRVRLEGKKSDDLLLEVGDVMFNATNSPDLVGKSAFIGSLSEPTTFSNHFIRLRANPEKLDGSYLARWLHTQFQSERFKGLCRQWVNQATVSREALLGLEIPLQPLPDQRRIAAILDQADALRAKRREALALLDELQRGIFIEMFGESKNFPQARLDELCELITDGTHQTPTYADEGVIFLSAKNVTSGKIDWVNVKYIPEWLHLDLHKRLAPQRNDILLAKNGTTGVAAIVDRDIVFDIYVSLALLRPKGEFLPCYIHAAINSDACRKQFSGALKGIGVPNLHLKEIRATLVPCPPLAVQIEFESRVARLEAVRADVEASLATLDALFSSLQYRAFRGEL